MAPRLQLDDALVDVAVEGGRHRRCRATASTATIDDRGDHVVLGVEGHAPIATRYVVAADGMWSPVRKAVGLAEPGYLGEWHAFRQYVRDVDGTAARDLFVWFDDDLLPGYAWSFPLPGGRANVGFGVLRDGTRRIQDMKALWAGLLDRPHIRAALGPRAIGEGRHTAWPIPARIDAAPLASGRVLLTGDAAMATDVLTGEGIGQALLTGRLAAEAILAGGALGATAVRRPLRARRPAPPRRRPPHVGPPRSGAGARSRRTRRDRRARPRRLVGPAQLRPLDVRGRAAGHRPHPVALAPPRARRAGRVHRLIAASCPPEPARSGRLRRTARWRRTRSRLAHVVEHQCRVPPRPSWTNTLRAAVGGTGAPRHAVGGDEPRGERQRGRRRQPLVPRRVVGAVDVHVPVPRRVAHEARRAGVGGEQAVEHAGGGVAIGRREQGPQPVAHGIDGPHVGRGEDHVVLAEGLEHRGDRRPPTGRRG